MSTLVLKLNLALAILSCIAWILASPLPVYNKTNSDGCLTFWGLKNDCHEYKLDAALGDVVGFCDLLLQNIRIASAFCILALVTTAALVAVSVYLYATENVDPGRWVLIGMNVAAFVFGFLSFIFLTTGYQMTFCGSLRLVDSTWRLGSGFFMVCCGMGFTIVALGAHYVLDPPSFDTVGEISKGQDEL